MTPSPRSKSFCKLHCLSEEIKTIEKSSIFVPFITITETWLKPYINDAQINIENYNVFRADRKAFKNGGALIYIHNKIIVEDNASYDDGICNAVACVCSNWSCIIICIYRPPNASINSFNNMLSFIECFIKKHNQLNKMQLFVNGDFNLPHLPWKTEIDV